MENKQNNELNPREKTIVEALEDKICTELELNQLLLKELIEGELSFSEVCLSLSKIALYLRKNNSFDGKISTNMSNLGNILVNIQTNNITEVILHLRIRNIKLSNQ